MRRGLIARSKAELPDAVFDARLERLRATMRGLDALLVYTNNTRPAGVSWLTGFIPYWSEAMLVLPRGGPPVLVVALTFRVKPWIERTSRVAEVVHTPRIGIESARLIAAGKADASVGIVDFDHLPAGIADDLREAGPRLTLSDASDLFAGLRASADPAEIMLTAHAASIAASALSRIDPCERAIGAIIAAVEGEARRLGAEEVYVAAAPDLLRDRRLARIESTRSDVPALGDRFAVRASVAYKGSWVRRVATIDRDVAAAARTEAAAAAFSDAIARLPSQRALAGFASFLVEGCRLSQPLETLMGTNVVDPCPPVAGAVVSVQACVEVEGAPVLLGAPALVGAPGAAASAFL
jgi:Creatinase/Prolidase N-terminal domain